MNSPGAFHWAIGAPLAILLSGSSDALATLLRLFRAIRHGTPSSFAAHDLEALTKQQRSRFLKCLRVLVSLYESVDDISTGDGQEMGLSTEAAREQERIFTKVERSSLSGCQTTLLAVHN